jgi:acyl-CoA thioester hydrolase
VEGFPFSTEIRVRFAETDAQGIAHHASFVVYLEVARVEYLEAYAGGYQSIRDRGLEALTTEVSVRYHRAAYFDERLTVWARCVDLRGARFRYEYRVVRGGELIAEAHTAHALVDRETYRPTRAPDWLLEALGATAPRELPAEVKAQTE